jgi:hypothetical protein
VPEPELPQALKIAALKLTTRTFAGELLLELNCLMVTLGVRCTSMRATPMTMGNRPSGNPATFF